MSEHKLPWGWAPQLGYGVLPDGTRVDHEGMITFLEQSLAHERQQAETWRDWQKLVEQAEADMTEALNQLNHERQQREAAEAAFLRASALADATEEALAESITRAEAAEAERDHVHAMMGLSDAEYNTVLKTYAAKLLALAVEQRRVLEEVAKSQYDGTVEGLRYQMEHEDWGDVLDIEGTKAAYELTLAVLATDLDALQAEAKELGIDATTPAMAPETGNAPR